MMRRLEIAADILRGRGEGYPFTTRLAGAIRFLSPLAEGGRVDRALIRYQKTRNAIRHTWIPQIDRDAFVEACSILRWPVRVVLVDSCEFGGPVLYYPVDDFYAEQPRTHVMEVSAEGTPREISRALYRAIMEAAQWEAAVKDRLALERHEDEDYNTRLVVLAPRCA